MMYSLSDWLIGIITGGFAIAIYYVSTKTISTRIFVVLLLLVSMWSISIGIMELPNTLGFIFVLVYSIQISYFLGILISSTFLLFSFSYPYDKNLIRRHIFILLIVIIIFACLIFFTDTIIVQSSVTRNITHPVWSYGSLWFLFDAYFVGCWFLGIFVIYKKFLNEKEIVLRRHLKILVIALIIGVIPPIVTSIFLPRFGVYSYDWLGPASSLIWIMVVAYSIVKHNLFNIKVIAIQIVTFGLWIFMIVRIFMTENSHDFLIESSLFVITVIFGVFLIRGVFHEIRQRQRIEELTDHLEKAYAQMKELNDEIEEGEIIKKASIYK